MSEPSGRVLVVDDDSAVRTVLAALLEQSGFASTQVASAAEALTALAGEFYDVVLSDVRMPGMGGIELLARITREYPDCPVIILTAHGSIPLAVQAMRAGAADFIVKPFDRDGLLYSLRKAMALAEQRGEDAPPPATSFHPGQPMRAAMAMLERVAVSPGTVLLRGESGTGKDHAARRLHALSPRSAGPFLKVHCAAFPESLLESELFGYEKGAFTGATSRKPGRVELAEGGTLFLDEIGELPPSMQVKLLRLLQDREFEALGGTRTLRADVRFVAATHRDLEELVRIGEFREDLYYRLNVLPVWIPPLRDRPDEVEALALQFSADLAAALGRPALTYSPQALEHLRRQPWPGNVRQLQNLVERLVILSDAPRIGIDDVERAYDPLPQASPSDAGGPLPFAWLDTRQAATERKALEAALERTRHNRTAAAKLLNISRRTFYNKLHAHGMI